jgi:hypothetical protein
VPLIIIQVSRPGPGLSLPRLLPVGIWPRTWTTKGTVQGSNTLARYLRDTRHVCGVVVLSDKPSGAAPYGWQWAPDCTFLEGVWPPGRTLMDR